MRIEEALSLKPGDKVRYTDRFLGNTYRHICVVIEPKPEDVLDDAPVKYLRFVPSDVKMWMFHFDLWRFERVNDNG